MRIKSDPVQPPVITSELQEAEYLPTEPTKRYLPGLGEVDIEPVDSLNEDIVAASETKRQNSDYQSQTPTFNLRLDASAGKIAAVIVLFVMLFALPVAISGDLFDQDNFKRQQVYTTRAINDASRQNEPTTNTSGQVAGVSDQFSTNSNTATTQNNGPQLLGVPVAVMMIIIGILAIAIPVYAVLRL